MVAGGGVVARLIKPRPLQMPLRLLEHRPAAQAVLTAAMRLAATPPASPLHNQQRLLLRMPHVGQRRFLNTARTQRNAPHAKQQRQQQQHEHQQHQQLWQRTQHPGQGGKRSSQAQQATMTGADASSTTSTATNGARAAANKAAQTAHSIGTNASVAAQAASARVTEAARHTYLRFKTLEDQLRWHGINVMAVLIALVLGSALVAIVLYFNREPLRDNLSSEISTAAKRSLSNEEVVAKANEVTRDMVHAVLTDQKTVEYAGQFVSELFAKPATREATAKLLVQVRG